MKQAALLAVAVALLVCGCGRDRKTVEPQGPALTARDQWCNLAQTTWPDLAVRGWQPQVADSMLSENGAPPEIADKIRYLRQLMRTSGTTPPGSTPPVWSAESLETAVQVDEWVLANCRLDPARQTFGGPCRAVTAPFPSCPRHPTTTR